MAIISTPLSTILNRMNRYNFAANIEEQYKVYDIDEAIRSLKRNTTLPWCIKKGTLKVFPDVLTYPVASDHDELIYLESTKKTGFSTAARFKYTSLQQFFEDPDNRNNMAEIWDNGVRYLGVRYKSNDLSNLLVKDASNTDDFTVSGDATAIAVDTVNYEGGNSSLKVTVVADTLIANVENTCAVNDTNYLKKYYFRSVYLSAVPTSIELRFGNDSSNYLTSGSLTTQFSGQAFKANDWNLLAFDLNDATTVGTIDGTAMFTYEYLKMNGAASGFYNIGNSYLKAWELLDYWYASTDLIVLNGSSNPTKSQFINDDAYDISDELVGDQEWADVIGFEAMLSSSTDVENSLIYKIMNAKANKAWQALYEKYPDMSPVIITNRWIFGFNSNDDNNTY